MQKVESKGFEVDSIIDWWVKNSNVTALRQHSREKATFKPNLQDTMAIAASTKRRLC